MLRVGQEELVVVGRVSHAASTSWPAVYGREAIWTWAHSHVQLSLSTLLPRLQAQIAQQRSSKVSDRVNTTSPNFDSPPHRSLSS